jgi:protein regulator of cytokinesis 1
METPLEEQQQFEHITCNIEVTEEDITVPGSLALDIIDQAEIEVARLDALKASKMKELVVKRRMELEEVCRFAHIEPDASTMEDKLIALIDSGEVDPSDLLSNLEEQITQAKQEASKRKEILEKMEKWMSACEEEGWLEDYNKDENRFASKGAHLNLKRAERARAAINKLPALVESLTLRTKAWEEERGVPFMFDGVRLLAMLDEYNYLRQEKDEEKRQLRDQKKIQEQMMNEKETLFGSKPSPIKPALTSKKANGVSRTSVGANGSQPNRRLSLGSAIMQPGTPEAPRTNGTNGSRANGKDMKRDRTQPAAALNYMNPNKDEVVGLASAGGSAPTSPRDR